MSGAISGAISGAMSGAISGTIRFSMSGAIRGTIRFSMSGAISGTIRFSMSGAISGTIRFSMSGAISGTIRFSTARAPYAPQRLMMEAISGAISGAITVRSTVSLSALTFCASCCRLKLAVRLDESHVARGRGCEKRCNGCGGRPDAETSKRMSVEVASATRSRRRRDARLYCSLRCKFAPLDEPCGSSGAVLGAVRDGEAGGSLVAVAAAPVAGAIAGGLERKASAVTSAILILVAGQWMRT